MRIVVASDHAGFERKEEIKEYLISKNIEIIDVGCFDKESVDYPDYGFLAATKVAKKEVDYGFVFCFTGIGIGIAANKIRAIRCATVTNVDQVEMSRRHNNVNMLSIGAKYVDKDLAIQLIEAFLNTPFEGGRHLRRVEKLDNHKEA